MAQVFYDQYGRPYDATAPAARPPASTGEIRNYTPTMRENAQYKLMGLLTDTFGMNTSRARGLSERLLGSENQLAPNGGIGLADFTPAGILFGAQEGGRDFGKGSYNIGEGEYLGGGVDAGMGLLGIAGAMLPGGRVAKKGIGKVADAVKVANAGNTSARASKADNIAAGLYHPIGGGNKLPKPPDQMTATLTPAPIPTPAKTISPEALLHSKLVPAVGDRSITGFNLLDVDGVPLTNPVRMEGGNEFMRTHSPDGTIWASDQGVVEALGKMTTDAAKDGSPVNLVYSAMGPTAVDYSTMMSEALANQIPNLKITKKAARSFDEEIRKIQPDFVGLNSPGLRDQLIKNGPLRLAFVKRMELDEFQKMGFPNVAAARKAITDPTLLDAPGGASGKSIGRLDPTGRVVTDPTSPHTTYNTQLGGNYLGGLEMSVPREIMFPDFFANRRAAGIPTAGDRRSFEVNNYSRTQNANQQWLDGVMGYMEKIKSGGLLD